MIVIPESVQRPMTPVRAGETELAGQTPGLLAIDS